MSIGVIYTNSHHENFRYIKESEKSAASFKRYLKGATFILYTDVEGYQSDVFDRIVHAEFIVPPTHKERYHKNGQMFVKHQAMLNETEYDNILVLGSDTYALKSDVNDMFRLLDNFDIAVAHAPVRVHTGLGNTDIPEISKAFPEYNCDVILYRNTEKVRKVILRWKQMYENDEFQHPHDQGAFRYAVYNSDLRIATLTPEYNYRGAFMRDDTVILQSRSVLERYLRAQTGGIISKTLMRAKMRAKEKWLCWRNCN